MKWAVAQSYRADNPAGDAISGALPKTGQRIEHRKALPHAEVGGALERLCTSGAYNVGGKSTPIGYTLTRCSNFRGHFSPGLDA